MQALINADRATVSELIERLLDAAQSLIEYLDHQDPDPDLEPSLVGPARKCCCADLECEHDGREPEDFV